MARGPFGKFFQNFLRTVAVPCVAGAALALAMLAPGSIPTASARQSAQDAQTKERPRKATDAAPPAKSGEGAPATPDDAKAVRSDVPEKTQANRREGVGEAAESEIVYYNNFMTTYRLGPRRWNLGRRLRTRPLLKGRHHHSAQRED